MCYNKLGDEIKKVLKCRKRNQIIKRKPTEIETTYGAVYVCEDCIKKSGQSGKKI
jgi:hypothetical protein